MLDGDVGKCQHDDVINDRPVVQVPFYAWHQVLLDPADGLCVVLEAESFMLVVDERLPKPDREADFLPAWYAMVMVRVRVEHLRYLHRRQSSFLHVTELVKRFDIVIVVKRVIQV